VSVLIGLLPTPRRLPPFAVVQGELNERRKAIVQKAFNKMDRDGSGVVDKKDLIGCFSAKYHPQVVTGEKTEAQVFNDFLKSFGGNADGTVTFQQFYDTYRDISASIPFDDDYFVLVITRSWQIEEVHTHTHSNRDLCDVLTICLRCAVLRCGTVRW
jgi:hypothetical protein